jgi:hypothetical protein
VKITKFSAVPLFTSGGTYSVHVPWDFLEDQLDHWQEREVDPQARLDLAPDFQRGHVWNTEQQTAYVEYCLRGGVSGRDIYFNCVGWMNTFKGPFVIVDGLQRLTAARAFLGNRITAFGSYYKEYTDRMRVVHNNFIFHVNDLKTRKQVLQWYLDLNTGGTPHTSEELERVKELLDTA